MINYLSYKDQIQGYRDVSDVLKTEEKIAASAINRLHRELTGLDSYQANIRAVMDRLAIVLQRDRPKTMTKGREALIMLSSDKGLTGGLWHRMADELLKAVKKKNLAVISVGSKGEKYLKEGKIPVEKSFADDKEAFSYILAEFRSGSLLKVDILYPKFVSISVQVPLIVPFLPIFPSIRTAKTTEGIASLGKGPGFPIFDPVRSRSTMFDGLGQKFIDAHFRKVSVERKLSEHAARTISMEHAGEKTEELIKGLSLVYRKERRRILTQKQLESFVAHKII